MTSQRTGLLVLRLAMAGVYLYFGLSQLMDGERWLTVVPEWATLSGLSAGSIVMMNGIFEVVLGSLLALGLWTRPVALVLAIHLFVISLGFGFTPTGIRDFGLSFATLSLFFLASSRGK